MALKLLVLQLATIVSIIVAGVLAFQGVAGWGWFLFVALLMEVPNSVNSVLGSKENETKND